MSDNVTTLPKFNPSNNEHVDFIKSRTEELMQYIQANVPKNRQSDQALLLFEAAAMWAVKANFV
jgi:hypothetical protein